MMIIAQPQLQLQAGSFSLYLSTKVLPARQSNANSVYQRLEARTSLDSHSTGFAIR